MTKDNEPVHTAEWRCDKCRRIWWDWRKSVPESENVKIDHHDSFAALEESAAAGCCLCSTFWAQIIYKDIPQDRLNSGRCVVEVMKSPNTPILGFSVGTFEFWMGLEITNIRDESSAGAVASRPWAVAKRNFRLSRMVISSALMIYRTYAGIA